MFQLDIHVLNFGNCFIYGLYAFLHYKKKWIYHFQSQKNYIIFHIFD